MDTVACSMQVSFLYLKIIIAIIHWKDICSNGHLDIVNYLTGRDDCDLSVFRDNSAIGGNQPTLHLFIA